MRFRAFDPSAREPVISVDGLAPAGPNFSHWPGNRTPAALKHDLSTGIALRLAALGDDARRGLLGGLDVVVNTHFDTDGVLSIFALLEPAAALRHRRLLLDAARTGDFQVFTTDEALLVELAIDAAGSAVPRALAGPQRLQRQVDDALALLPALLDDPWRARPQVARAFDAIRADVALAAGPDVAHFSGAREAESAAIPDLAVVTAPRPLHRIAANTAAGDASRVLVVVPAPNEPPRHLFRAHDRVEGWFDVVSFARPARPALDAARDRLAELEDADPADPGCAAWRCDAPHEPVPELWFGVEEGHVPFGGPHDPDAWRRPADLRPSRLSPRLVAAALRESAGSRSRRDARRLFPD